MAASHQPLLGKAERGAPEAGHALQIFLAAVVIDIDALALRDHGRAGDLVRLEVGVGVDDGGDIAACERIGLGDHGILRNVGRREAAIVAQRGGRRQTPIRWTAIAARAAFPCMPASQHAIGAARAIDGGSLTG